MKIAPIGLFATPESMDALNFNLEQLSGGERTAGSLMMGLTWNYLANQVNEEPASVSMILGGRATLLYSEGENRLSKLKEVGNVNTYTFSTQEDLQQALQMFCDGEDLNSITMVDGELQE